MTLPLAADFAAIRDLGDLPQVTVAYAQGSNSKSGLTALLPRVRDVPAQDADAATLSQVGRINLAASDFTSGFSGTSPVYPAPGDVLTVTGDTDAWTVAEASLEGQGAWWRLTLTRRVGRGTG